MASRLKTLLTSSSKKGTQIYYSLHTKVPTNKPTLVSPLKDPLLRVSVMESLAVGCPTTRNAPPLEMPLHKRCPITTILLHSSIKLPGIPLPSLHPNTTIPSDRQGPPWRQMPISRDFLNIPCRVPRGSLHGAFSKRDPPSPEPSSSNSKIPR